MSDLKQCRVCLSVRSDLEPMFNPDKNTVLNIYLVTGVKMVELKDKENALICNRCLADLALALEFRKRCILSDESMQNFYGPVEKSYWEQVDIMAVNRNSSAVKNEDIYKQVIKVEPDDIMSDVETDYDDTWVDYTSFRSSLIEPDIVLDEKTLASLTCPYCYKKLNTRRSLKYHIQVKHEIEKHGKYECDYCGKAFPNKHPLKRHIKQAHLTLSSKYILKSETDMPCIVCRVVLKNRKSYRNHVRHKHPKWLDIIFPKVDTRSGGGGGSGSGRPRIKQEEEPQCPCAICGKIFKNKRNLAQHEKTHRVLLPHEYYYCDLCGNKFKEKILMQIHIRKRHIQKIRYQCEQCTCSYTTNHALQIHIKVRHKNIRDWICNWCGKDFGEKKKLVAHERIHTGEQPYHCHICDAKFTHQTDYRRHKWNHEGRKSYKCNMCGEGYVKRSELISHKNRCHLWKAYQQQQQLQQQQQQFSMYPPNMPLN